MRPHAICLFLLAATSLADQAASEARFITGARQLIYEGKRSGEGYFRPDGKALIFQSEREEGNPFYQIYTLDLASGDSVRVSPGQGKTTCAFFQPGTSRVMFASTHHDPQAAAKQKAELEFRASGKERRYAWDYDEAMDIFTANADGTQVVQLTKERGYDAEGAFSADGKQIVFCSLRGAYERELNAEEKQRLEKDAAWFGDIYLMNADGTNVRRLTTAPGYDGGPFFSPDGQRIIWRRFDEHGMNADVFTMKTDGSDVKRLTDFKAMSWAPYFHPSGKYVVFTSNKLGFENFELFIVDADGAKEPVRATFTDGFDGLPVFSPDGAKLCWTSNRTADKKSQLFLANWNHDAALAALGEAPVATKAKAMPDLANLTRDILKGTVEWLAAPEREGRGTGSPGAAASAEWMVNALKDYKLKPLGGDSFLRSFEFRAGEKLIADKNTLRVNDTAFTVEKDFRPLAFTENGEGEGEVIFAGYGLSAPEGNGQPRYNSYDGLEVKDKVVLLLRYVPEGVEPQRRAHLNRYAGLRYKVMMARERGAKGVLVVTGPNSPNAGEVLKMTNDGSNADSGLPAMSISGAVAEALLAASGKKLKDLQAGLDNENPHAEGGFALPKTRVKFTTGIEHIRKTDNNVIAALPGQTDEWVVIGAHYDHLGLGEQFSMAPSMVGTPHPGADDNASGTAGVIELARYFASQPRHKRGILFVAFAGEELGLLGSSYYVNNPAKPLEKAVAMINMDMIGRLKEGKVYVGGVGTGNTLKPMLEGLVSKHSALKVDFSEATGYGSSDHTSFTTKQVPVLFFFSGLHGDYHKPSDTWDKINAPGATELLRLVADVASGLSEGVERPQFVRVKETKSSHGAVAGSSAGSGYGPYFGSIPDFGEVPSGVKFVDVRDGSPAALAGLKGGDILVEFDGKPVQNLYDFTYLLRSKKAGDEVVVRVLRGTEKVEARVVLASRK